MRGEEKCVDIEIMMYYEVHAKDIVIEVYDKYARKKLGFYKLQSIDQIPKYLRGQMAVLDMGDDINSMARRVDGIGFRHLYTPSPTDGKRVVVYRIRDVPEGKIKELTHAW